MRAHTPGQTQLSPHGLHLCLSKLSACRNCCRFRTHLPGKVFAMTQKTSFGSTQHTSLEYLLEEQDPACSRRAREAKSYHFETKNCRSPVERRLKSTSRWGLPGMASEKG